MIEIDEYEKDPEREGFLRRVRRKTVREVYDLLRAELQKREMIDESFSIFPTLLYAKYDEHPFPDGQHLACFAVTGGSEGHYVHVEVIRPQSWFSPGGTLRHDTKDNMVKDVVVRPAQIVFLAKTFLGFDHAWAIAKVCAEELGA